MSEIPDDAWPAGDRLEWADDVTRTHHDFLNETTRDYTDAENAAADVRLSHRTLEDNRVALLKQAREALAANREFMALKAPTSAQASAQVRALTRQMNAVIRLVVGDLTGTD